MSYTFYTSNSNSKTKEEEQKESMKESNIQNNQCAVLEHRCFKIPYHNEKQEIPLVRCVQKLFISTFLGEFKIFDNKGKLLGESVGSKISFKEKDLQTEPAEVWYHATSLSDEFKNIQEKYDNDPGLCFSNTDKIFLQFLNGKSLEQDAIIMHVPVFFNVSNIWCKEKRLLMF